MALAAPLELDLGDGRVLHAFKTHCGIMFSMGEIASTIFYENPSAFGKFDLVPVLKIALMRMVTQEAASMMGQGKHEDALALALDAIKQGQKIFFPKAPLQLVPLYLLAVQICLCLGRTIQCQELLGIASWLFLQAQASNENYEMHAEISRLFGQLYVLQNNLENALQAFSEEIYYVSLEHGVLDIRTSIGFYNIFKVLKSLDILELREQILGSSHNNVGDAFFAIGLIYLYEKDLDQSLKSLNRASIMYIVKNEAMHDLVNKSISLIKDMRVIDDKS